MLEEILYNDIFGLIICLFSIFGITLFSIIDTKPESNRNKTSENKDIVEKTQFIVFVIEIVLLVIFTGYLYIKHSQEIMLTLSIIAMIYTVFKLFTKITYKKQEIYLYLCSSYFYLLFFRSSTLEKIFQIIKNFNINIQESCLLLIMFMKIALFIYLFLLNSSIIISYINKMIPKEKIEKLIRKRHYTIKMNKYNFLLYTKKRNKFRFIVDLIVFILLSPFSIILFISKLIIFYSIKYMKETIGKIIYSILSFSKDADAVIKKISKISVVLTIIFIYILVIYDSFTLETKELYNIIAITIICPVVIDSINTKTRVI